MKRILYILLLLASGLSAFAQTDRREVRRGNREFKRNDFKQSEISYRKALVKDSTSFAGNYNLASALYRQNDFEAAANALSKLKEQSAGNVNAADYWFNSGDVALQKKDYQAAVDAFRQSLILRPDDMAAKRNYVYAKKMLENQQNQDNKNDQQDRQDNKDNQNNQDNQNDQQDQQNQGQQPQSRISPQQGQQIIQAMQAKEKDTQEKVNKEKAAQLYSKQKEKNW